MIADELDSSTEVEDDASSTYLTFDLGEQILGVEVRHVREILDMQKITRLPNAPMDVRGVVDVRGTSVPIIDLKNRLGVPATEGGEEARIVVVEIDTGAGPKPLGVLADRVRNVEQIPAEDIEPSPSVGVANWDSSIIHGLFRRGSDLVVLVDLERILGRAGRNNGLDLGSSFF